jgi:hypothetical protein
MVLSFAAWREKRSAIGNKQSAISVSGHRRDL